MLTLKSKIEDKPRDFIDCNLAFSLHNQNKDNTESLKVLNEQLQSKEVELLQLRTEVETQQGMPLTYEYSNRIN